MPNVGETVTSGTVQVRTGEIWRWHATMPGGFDPDPVARGLRLGGATDVQVSPGSGVMHVRWTTNAGHDTAVPLGTTFGGVLTMQDATLLARPGALDDPIEAASDWTVPVVLALGLGAWWWLS